MIKYTESDLESAFIELIGQQDIPHRHGSTIEHAPEEVLLEDDLRTYLKQRYASAAITDAEITRIVNDLKRLSAADLYGSNKAVMKMLSDGFRLRRDDASKKDLHIELLDLRFLESSVKSGVEEPVARYAAEQELPYGDAVNCNRYCLVTQLEIVGQHKRIPDGIIYVNGLPLVVLEFKSAIRIKADCFEAYTQITTRYRRDIPELFKYNAFCVLSDGSNTKAGSFFAPYDKFNAWRRMVGMDGEAEGIESLFTLVKGMLNPTRLLDIVRNFIYLPDKSNDELKIVCRYPQYYAARKLFASIKQHQRPDGDGKGGTYFGATGCGKSITMLFLSRLLMRSLHFGSPTLILITDRTDLDDQLSQQFTNAKGYIGDNVIHSVSSREDLRDQLQGRQSGGVFLTTIHKFTEDTKVLTERTNVICIADEAHRSQVNLDQKITVTEEGVKKSWGFAKYLHDSLPNATFVGFTGTPVSGTLNVFGEVVDAYTMTESVADEITVPIVYEGRAARVFLDHRKLHEVEKQYEKWAEEGTNPYQIEESKKSVSMETIIGDPDRLQKVANDFIEHYERRVSEGATLKGKAMFVCSSQDIAWAFYQNLIALRPEWAVEKQLAAGETATAQELQKLKPMPRVKMVMTRRPDHPAELYDMLGTKEYRKMLDGEFKKAQSNFKIAIVVDMWLTGFDVPFLDTIYIDKPVQEHNLIQTISRVNRKHGGKQQGLVVDYIGIKKKMDQALKQFSKSDAQNFKEVQTAVVVVKDHLALLASLFHEFDATPYFSGTPLEQLKCLNKAAEFAQLTKKQERRFMDLVRRLKTAYDISTGSEDLSQAERDYIHFYLAIRSIIVKITVGDTPDVAQMNAKIMRMVEEALQSDGVEEVVKISTDSKLNVFDPDYLARIQQLEGPNTKFKILQKLLEKAIGDFKKVNKTRGIDFSKRMQKLVDQYNDRTADIDMKKFLDELVDELVDLYYDLEKEKDSGADLGIDVEEKAFYDILKEVAKKFGFEYPDEKLLVLAKKVKQVVDSHASTVDWNLRADIKAGLKVALILLLSEHDYPPTTYDEVYAQVFEQAENFKRYREG